MRNTVSVPASSYLMSALDSRGILVGGLTVFPPNTQPGPDWDLVITHERTLDVIAIDGIDPADHEEASSIIQTLDPVDQVHRSMLEIYTDVQKLTATQLSNLYQAIAVGVPSKLMQTDDETLWLYDWLLRQPGDAYALDELKRFTISVWCKLWRYSLMAPEADKSVWISGFKPA